MLLAHFGVVIKNIEKFKILLPKLIKTSVLSSKTLNQQSAANSSLWHTLVNEPEFSMVVRAKAARRWL